MSESSSPRRRIGAMKSTLAVALLGGCAGALVTQNFSPSSVPVSITPVHAAVESALPTGGFAPVLRRVTPAVVNISSSKLVKASMRGSGNQRAMPALPPGLRDLFGFGGPEMEPRDRRESSLGSGVIVDQQNGYVLTNNHVVEGATTVKVALPDRREFDAKIVGRDPQTDVAVLKISGGRLPVVPLGDSSKVQVGDLALAVGNPFGLGQTVTMGIIGATGRSGLGIENYEDFIQTDAAINPGNSGGALVNTNGELVAINTAILSGSGGNQGVGFAIPINMVREVMDQLVKNGKVTRGYMGVQVQTVTPTIARSFRLADNTDGVVISNVEQGDPADRAGIKVGDVVTAINGQSVADQNQFRLRVSRSAPGSTLKFTVVREGKSQEIPVTLATFPRQPGDRDDSEDGAAKKGSLEGISVEPLSAQAARQLGLPARTQGVVVSDVDEASAAAQAGLREGDVIQSVNRRPVTTVAEFESAMRQAGNSALLLVNRGGATRFVAIEQSK